MSPKPKKGSVAAIGARIKELRMAAGLTQTEAGQAVNVSWQQFAKYEAGKNRVSADTLAALAKRFKCQPADFFA